MQASTSSAAIVIQNSRSYFGAARPPKAPAKKSCRTAFAAIAKKDPELQTKC
jgi:hypothetical protein